METCTSADPSVSPPVPAAAAAAVAACTTARDTGWLEARDSATQYCIAAVPRNASSPLPGSSFSSLPLHPGSLPAASNPSRDTALVPPSGTSDPAPLLPSEKVPEPPREDLLLLPLLLLLLSAVSENLGPLFSLRGVPEEEEEEEEEGNGDSTKGDEELLCVLGVPGSESEDVSLPPPLLQDNAPQCIRTVSVRVREPVVRVPASKGVGFRQWWWGAPEWSGNNGEGSPAERK